MEITNFPVGALRPAEHNSRTHSETQIKQIASSIAEFGFTNPILVDEYREIIAGHGRLLAAEYLGHTSVPCVVLRGLSPAQKRAYLIADNQLPLNAGWDIKVLKAEIEALQDEDFNIDVLGFDLSFLDDVFKTETVPDDADDIPEAQEDVVTVDGDIWLLGNHRIMCGDSTNLAVVSDVCMGEKAQLFITDPPYNVDYVGKTSEALTIQNDKKSDAEFRQFLTDAFTAANANLDDGGVFYIWHADSEGYNFKGACRDVDWQVRECLVWAKNHMVMGRQDYHWQHEPCLYGWRGGAAHLWNSDRKQTTLLNFDRPPASRDHPTMKPVELFGYLIGNSSHQGDIVLDTFAGSGTSIIACEHLNRRCFSIELDPVYVDVAVRRWQEFTGRSAVNARTARIFDAHETA